MHVEKLGENKVRIFISYDDLEERGIDRDEIWQNGNKVQELFWDMMERAYVEVGFEVIGPIAVEAFTMPTEGVVVIVTQIPSLPGMGDQPVNPYDPLDHEIGGIGTSDDLIFVFQDFEDVVRVARDLKDTVLDGCSLYHYQGRYYLCFTEEAMAEFDNDSLWAVIHEYGNVSSTTEAVLEEYGKLIIARNAIPVLTRYFSE